MPYFSVIIPSFNSIAYIETAIKSVLSQSFTDFELLIIDSLSTDGTGELIALFADQDNRIRLVREKDNGIYDAMNKGVSICKGEWIYFLGSDDSIFNADVLEKIYQKTLSDSLDFLYGDVLFQPSGNRYAGEFNYINLLKKNICHQAIFYRKSVFDVVGPFNVHFKQHADWDLNLSVFSADKLRKAYYNGIIANFTTGSTSASHDRTFLKERLIPDWVLHFDNPSLIPNNIKNFDDWWRLLRNSEMAWDKQKPYYFPQLPTLAKRIIQTQSIFPMRIIKTGIFSKLIMAIAFIKIGK